MTRKVKQPKLNQGKHLVPTPGNSQGADVTFTEPIPPPARPKPSDEDMIVGFFQCAFCKDELPDGVSPQEFHAFDVGWTQIGIQVWCHRHNCNIVHIDFEGHQHPATM